MIVPYGVDCRAVASGMGIINHIIMDERRIMKHFNGRSGGDSAPGDFSKQLCAEYDQYGADLFTFGFQIITDNLIHH